MDPSSKTTTTTASTESDEPELNETLLDDTVVMQRRDGSEPIVYPDHIFDARNCVGLAGAIGAAHGKARKAFVTGFTNSEALFVIDGANAVRIDIPSDALFDEAEFAAAILEVEHDELDEFREQVPDSALKLIVMPDAACLQTGAGLSTGIPVNVVFPETRDVSNEQGNTPPE